MNSLAYFFLNRYLDLRDAIEEGGLQHLDNSNFVLTDLPPVTALPQAPAPVGEDVKDWVLTASIEGGVDHGMPSRNCDGCRGGAVAFVFSPLL